MGDVDSIKLAQDREWWWAFLNEVTNIRIPQNAGYFLTT